MRIAEGLATFFRSGTGVDVAVKHCLELSLLRVQVRCKTLVGSVTTFLAGSFFDGPSP